MILAQIAYVLCAIGSGIAAFLLLRSYFATHTKLLLWSGWCFVLLAAENLFIFLDMVVIPDYDLRLVRVALGLGGFVCLLYGLIWERSDT